MKKIINFSTLSLLMAFLLTGCVPQTKNITKTPIIVRQSGGQGLLIAECADKNYLTNIASYIIEGTVTKVESKWNDEKTSIFTYSDLSIDNYLKGDSLPDDKIQIITPGGVVGDIGQAVEDQPIFHQGKKVKIYLQEVNGEFEIVCGRNGVEETEKAGMANPASQSCIEKGGSSFAA